MLPLMFCIYMPQRKEYAAAQFKRLNLDVKMFPAFQGTKMGLCTNKPYLFDHPTDYWAPPYGTGTNPPFFCGSGIQSLSTSNFAIIKMCLAMGIDEVMIFEDDIILPDNFVSEFDLIQKELPSDYEMLHLSYCCMHWLHPYSMRLKRGKVLCTPCQMYSRKGMERIEAEARLMEPFDIFLFNVFNDTPQYVADPMLVKQASIDGILPTTLS
jgi:hypothetical protein